MKQRLLSLLLTGCMLLTLFPAQALAAGEGPVTAPGGMIDPFNSSTDYVVTRVFGNAAQAYKESDVLFITLTSDVYLEGPVEIMSTINPHLDLNGYNITADGAAVTLSGSAGLNLKNSGDTEATITGGSGASAVSMSGSTSLNLSGELALIGGDGRDGLTVDAGASHAFLWFENDPEVRFVGGAGGNGLSASVNGGAFTVRGGLTKGSFTPGDGGMAIAGEGMAAGWMASLLETGYFFYNEAWDRVDVTEATQVVDAVTVQEFIMAQVIDSAGNATNYGDLSEAFTAAPSGSTVKLMAHVTVDNICLDSAKTITIDLNGYNYLDASPTKPALEVMDGTLILTDSKGEGTLTDGGAHSAIKISAGGALIIEGDEPFIIQGGEEMYEAVHAIEVMDGALTVTAPDVKVDGGTYGAGLYVHDTEGGSAVTISGGAFSGVYGLFVEAVAANSQFTISGGSFQGSSEAISSVEAKPVASMLAQRDGETAYGFYVKDGQGKENFLPVDPDQTYVGESDEVVMVKSFAPAIHVQGNANGWDVDSLFPDLDTYTKLAGNNLDGTITLLDDTGGVLGKEGDEDSTYASGDFTLTSEGEKAHTLSRGGESVSQPILRLGDNVEPSPEPGNATLKNVILDGSMTEPPGELQDTAPIVDMPRTESGSSLTLGKGAVLRNNGYYPQLPPAEPPVRNTCGGVDIDEDGASDITLGKDSRVEHNLGVVVGGVGLAAYATGDHVLDGGVISGNVGMGDAEEGEGGTGGVWVSYDASFNIVSGSIEGNASFGMLGAGGVSTSENSVLTVEGGSIKNNTGVAAGGVFIMSGKLIMSGGSITGNRAGITTPPEFWADQPYDFAGAAEQALAMGVLGGGVVAGNASVQLSGDIEIKDNYIGEGEGTPSNLVLLGTEDAALPAVVTGALTGGTGSIGVSLKTAEMGEGGFILSPASGTVVRGATADEMTALNGGVSTKAYGLIDTDLAAFTSDDPDYELEWGTDENQAKVIRLIPRGVAVVVETKEYCETLPAAVEAAKAGETVRLIQDTTLAGTLAVAKELTLDLNGHTVTGAADRGAIKVKENGHLTLHDETGTGLVQGMGLGNGINIDAGGKLTLSGKVHVQGRYGVACQSVLALAPGAWPTLEGNFWSEGYGGSGLIFQAGCDAAKSFPLPGGTYRGKTASVSSGSGVVFEEVPSGPVFTGGRFIAGKAQGGTAVKIEVSGAEISDVIPNYCYFAQENINGAPGTPIEGLIGQSLESDVWVVQSGGPVHNAEELQTALGGPEYAARSGDTVTLLQNVKLYGPLWFEGGTMTLDLGEFVLTGTKTVVKRDNPAGEGKITLSAPALELVRDTDLTITGDGKIMGPDITESGTSAPAGHSGVVVGTGCTLTLAGVPEIWGGDFNVPQTGGGTAMAGAGVFVAGGTLRVVGQPSLTGGNTSVGTSQAPAEEDQTPAQGGCGLLLQGAKVEGPIAGGEYYGGAGYLNGNQAHDYDGPGLSSLGTDLTITGGDYSGGSGLLCGTDGAVRVEGGEFTGWSAEGAGASLVPGVFGTNGGLTLSGGKFTFSDSCTAALRVSDEVSLTADGLLADGRFYYDENWVELDGQTGKTVDKEVNVARAFWEDHADTSWYQESQDAFTLTTPAQLAGLAKLTNDEGKSFTGKTVTLGADLDLSDYDWKPIGIGADFDGLFDGQGHAITGMVIDRTNEFLNNGLFQTVTGSIRNLTLAGRIPKRGNMNGGLVFVLSSGGAVENCAVFLESGGIGCGSVAGQVNAGTVLRNCYAAGTLTATSAKAVVCVVEDDATVEDCYYRDDMPADEKAQALAEDYMRSPAFADDLNAWVEEANEAAGKELYVRWQGHDGDYPDFQTASTGGDSGSTGGGTTAPGKTETNPDGSKTTTVTDKKTGTVTETTQGENGVETVVETKMDGTVTAKVTVPEEAVQPPATGGLPVIEIPGSLPLGEGGPTQAGTGEGNGGTAPQGGPAVQIDLPESLDTPVIVSLPVTDGTVVIQVAADGTETPVALSLVEDGRAYVILDQGATLKIETREGYFDDTTGTPAEGPADFGAARNLWEGTGERQFSPEMGMNRAMLAVVLWRLDGAESLGEAVPYGDVDQDAWYASAAAWGTKSGVVQGTGAGFAPDVALTTEQMIVMLYRYTTYADLLVPPVGDGDGAEMPEGASSWAYEAIQWAINAGLLELGEDGDLTAPLSRGEASAIMQSYVQYLVKR